MAHVALTLIVANVLHPTVLVLDIALRSLTMGSMDAKIVQNPPTDNKTI